MTVIACGLPLLGLLTLLPLRRGRKLFVCLCFAILCGTAGLIGCGGNSTPAQSSQTKTPAGSYTFDVVATSGSSMTKASYSLTVQ